MHKAFRCHETIEAVRATCLLRCLWTERHERKTCLPTALLPVPAAFSRHPRVPLASVLCPDDRNCLVAWQGTEGCRLVQKSVPQWCNRNMSPIMYYVATGSLRLQSKFISPRSDSGSKSKHRSETVIMYLLISQVVSLA